MRALSGTTQHGLAAQLRVAHTSTSLPSLRGALGVPAAAGSQLQRGTQLQPQQQQQQRRRPLAATAAAAASGNGAPAATAAAADAAAAAPVATQVRASILEAALQTLRLPAPDWDWGHAPPLPAPQACCPSSLPSLRPAAPLLSPPPAVPKQDRKAGSGKIGEASGRGMVDLNPPRGTRDFFPDDKRLQNWLFGEFAAVSRLYGFEQIDFPVLESGKQWRKLGLGWGWGGVWLPAALLPPLKWELEETTNQQLTHPPCHHLLIPYFLLSACRGAVCA